MAGPLEPARLDLQRVELPVAVGIKPPAERITHERRLDLLRPVATVRIDATRMLDPVDQQNRLSSSSPPFLDIRNHPLELKLAIALIDPRVVDERPYDFEYIDA